MVLFMTPEKSVSIAFNLAIQPGLGAHACNLRLLKQEDYKVSLRPA